ncbi:hypothetical protein ACSQ67_024978 [Phaseolus vulgaris]
MFTQLVSCLCFNISMTLSRQLLYRWSVEELRLATGAKGITYLQHQLKLRSAYSGVPVCCFNLLDKIVTIGYFDNFIVIV